MHLFVLSFVTTMGIVALAGCQASQDSAGNPSAGSSGTVAAGAIPDADNADNAGNVATMWLRGMACPQCSYNVDLQLKKVRGVEKVSVNMRTGQVQAWLSPTNPPTRAQLEDAIESTTFTLVRLDMPQQR
jgi:copper chaperone CopZ